MYFAIFLRNFSKILSKFPINCVFRLNGQKLKPWFANFFEKYAKIMHFRNFIKKIFEKFRKFSQKFPANRVFRQNSQKLNAGLVKFFEKYAKKSFFSHFLKKFFVLF